MGWEINFGFAFIYLFVIYLSALGLSRSTSDLYLWHVESSSPTRDQTWAPCIGSVAFFIIIIPPLSKSPTVAISASHTNLKY